MNAAVRVVNASVNLALQIASRYHLGMHKSALLLLAACLSSYGQTLNGWNVSGTVRIDDSAVRESRPSILIDRAPGIGDGISGISKNVAMDFQGQTLTLTAWLRTENVTGYVGLWMREDGDSGPVEFDNMQRRQVKGTNDWQQYTVTLRLNPDGKRLFFGVFVQDSGKVWVDSASALVDGKPLASAEARDPQDCARRGSRIRRRLGSRGDHPLGGAGRQSRARSARCGGSSSIIIRRS